MALLLLAAAVIGLGGFQRIADTQDSVVEKAVPVLRNAHAVTELNSRLSTLAQGMTEVRTEDQQRVIKASLDRYIQAFAPLIASLKSQGIDERFLQPISASVARLNQILGELNVELGNRIRLQGRLDALSTALGEDLLNLNGLADSLVANATARTTAVTSSLYDLVETNVPADELYRVFDRLVEIDIDAMERTHELRQRSADLNQIISQVVKEDDLAEIDRLAERAGVLVSILNRRIGEITDPQRKQRARKLLNVVNLDEAPSDLSSIFLVRKSLLALQHRLQVSEQVYQEEAGRLNKIVSELSANSGAVMTAASAAAQTSLNESRRRFLLTVVTVVLLMALILWRYVHHDVLRRLLGLKDATLAIAGGHLDHPVEDSGRDEISAMAKALRLFRDNALAKERLDEELKSYKDNLELTVRERTLQLEQTNTRLAEEAAQHDIAREKAELANQAKTDFLATISHELRTPLSGALGTLDLLSKTGLTPEQRRYLETVNTSNTLLLDILDNVLGYSQVRAGKIELLNRDFELRHLVGKLVATMEVSANEKGVSLHYQIDPSLSPTLHGDSGKLSQILMNLVGNAVKFTNQGSVSLTVKSIADSEHSNDVEFVVKDTGIGIPDARREEMFKAFTQADTSISRHYGGVGLGLAICQRLARLMQGSIEMESKLGEGTTVCLRLPLSPGQEVMNEGVSQPTKTDTGLDILLVEDDPTMMEISTAYLRHLGHDVRKATDGESALRSLELSIPDILLLDISLPGVDGIQVLQQLRQHVDDRQRAVPVVAMSAHVFEEEVAAYLAAGMDGFLGKPFTPEALQAAISAALEVRTPCVPDTFSAAARCETGWRDQQVLESSMLQDDIVMLGIDKVRALLNLFRKNGERYLEQLADLEKSSNQVGIREVAHRMRSAAGNFGFYRLTALLTQIEGGSAGRLRDVDEVFRQSLNEAERVLDSVTVAQNM